MKAEVVAEGFPSKIRIPSRAVELPEVLSLRTKAVIAWVAERVWVDDVDALAAGFKWRSWDGVHEGEVEPGSVSGWVSNFAVPLAEKLERAISAVVRVTVKKAATKTKKRAHRLQRQRHQ